MTETTITLSTKGQFALPKKIREADALSSSDVFRLERLGRGKYILERLLPPPPSKAKLVRSRDGFVIYKPQKNSRPITSHQIKELEAETT